MISFEDWQQGLAVVSYRDGDEPFSLEGIYIDTMSGHRAVYGGKVYRARPMHGITDGR